MLALCRRSHRRVPRGPVEGDHPAALRGRRGLPTVDQGGVRGGAATGASGGLQAEEQRSRQGGLSLFSNASVLGDIITI